MITLDELKMLIFGYNRSLSFIYGYKYFLFSLKGELNGRIGVFPGQNFIFSCIK